MIPLARKMSAAKGSHMMKIVICVACAAGFVYQSIQFAFLYLSRPTIMDITVTEPLYLDMPAITFCNGNPIRRRIFCKEFPDDCVTKDNETICPAYPQFCHNSSDPFYMMFPKKWIHFQVDPNVFKTAGHESSSLLQSCVSYTTSQEQCDIAMNNIYPIQAVGLYRTMINNCYTINFNATNPRSVVRFSGLAFKLGFEADEYHHHLFPTEIYFSIHDPRTVGNPFADGYTIKPSKVYKITPHETRRTLLPPPFSNCTTLNYPNDDGLDKKFMKALDGMPCLERCKAMFSFKNCGCLDRHVKIYIGNIALCDRKKECVSYDERISCVTHCGSLCQTRTYDVTIKESDFVAPEVKVNSDGKSDVYAIFLFFLTGFTLTEYTYKPQFQSIEVFSYIGGYVGIWLGISLISVYELVVSTLQTLAAKKLADRKAKLKQKYPQPLFHKSTSVAKSFKRSLKNHYHQ